MKNMKKILALVLATMLLVAMAVPAMAVAADPSVSVTGLIAGDTVKYYQVLTWDNSVPGWALADGFTSLATNSLFNSEDAVADIIDGLTQTQANAIAALAKDATVKFTDSNITGTSSTYTLTDVLPEADPEDSESTAGDGKPDNATELGLYMAVITAGTPKYVYNPVFVSADFKTDNGTASLDASSATYGSEGAAKRQEIEVLKTTEDANSTIATAIDSYVGQEVTFYVDTTIPVFLDSYTDPSFVIFDKIVDNKGVNLVANSILVTLGEDDDAVTYAKEANTEKGYVAYDAGIFSVTENTQDYTVTFTKDYLDANVVSVPVHIEYKGTITDTATFNVNQEANEVTVTYSNGPGTEKAALRDRTNHYTFSIGGNIFGAEGENGKTFELVKVGVDGDGKPVVEQKPVSNWSKQSDRHPLAGATFALKVKNDKDELVPYTNSIYPEGATCTTIGDGVITFNGLAEGTYYLEETDAPSGYVKDTRIVEIKIDAYYDEVEVPATTDGGIEVAGYTVDVLKKYTVSVGNVSVYDSDKDEYGAIANGNKVVSTYTYDSEGPVTTTIIEDDTVVHDSDMTNTPGVELPSTGGIGTTIFYVGGGILVLLAVILLVTKRRMSGND